MASFFGNGEWAIFNLMIVSLAFLCFLLLAVLLLVRYSRRQHTVRDLRLTKGTEDEVARNNPLIESPQPAPAYLPWVLVSGLAGMVGIFLYAFSQDFTGLRAVFDQWSTAQVLIFAVQIISTVIALRNSNAEETSSKAATRQGSPDDYSERPAPESVRESVRLKLRSDDDGSFKAD